MKRILILPVLAALVLSGCGSQKNVTRNAETSTESHFLDEVVREVSVDTSKSEKTTVTVTEWYYAPVAEDEVDDGESTVSPQPTYVRQTTYTKEKTESGVTEAKESETTRIDTATNTAYNENTEVERGKNSVTITRTVALIVGLAVLLVICLTVLIIVWRYKR